MSVFRSFGRGYFALGLTIGVLATTFLFVWVFSWFRDPANQKECTYDQAANNCKEAQNLSGFQFSEFIYVTPSDTLAQWAMAVVAVLATGISVWAVFLIRSTLKATTDTLAVTRGIGEQQLRAYVQISIEMGGDYDFSMDPKITVAIKNVGQTPAVEFSIHGYFAIFPYPPKKGQKIRLESPKWDTPAPGYIASGDTYRTIMPLEFEYSESEILTAWESRKTRFYAIGRVAYKDVFGETHQTDYSWSLKDMGPFGDAPTSDKKSANRRFWWMMTGDLNKIT